MMLRRTRRDGALVVECAVVLPLFLLLTLGLIIGAIGVFRYQEMAALSREGARYAAVNGAKSVQGTNKAAATPKDIYEQAIVPRAVALDLSRLNYTVTWTPDNRQGSMVTVTLTYQWLPEAFLGGITLTSTSSMTVCY